MNYEANDTNYAVSSRRSHLPSHHRLRMFSTRIRVLVASLSMLGTAIMYITRVNLNIAILAMVPNGNQQPYPPSSERNTQFTNDSFIYCPIDDYQQKQLKTTNQSNLISSEILRTPTLMLNDGEFDWSPPEQGIILGSFFYGYIVTQIIGGRLSESYFSPAKLIFIALSASGIINLMTPFLARISLTTFVISRIILGAAQGIVYPAFYCLFSKWIPENERSTFIPWLDVGTTIGTVLISALSGHIIVFFSQFGGWPVVFYVSGLLALLWSALWALFVTSEPEDHPWITERELDLIAESREREGTLTQSAKPSWKNILMSSAFHAVLIPKICFGIMFDLVTLKIPAYLQDVIHLPVHENGVALALINVGYTVTLLACGPIADWLISGGTRYRLNKCQVRKLFELISGVITGGSLLLLPYVAGCNKWANVGLLAVAMFGNGFTSGGDVPIVADNAGSLSGTVFAIMNTICSISGFAVPYVVGVVVSAAPYSFLLWSSLINVCAILVLLSTLVFVAFATSHAQMNWSKSSEFDQLVEEKVWQQQQQQQQQQSVNVKKSIPSLYNTFPIALVK